MLNAVTCAGVQARVTEELGWVSSCHQLSSCTLLTPTPLNQAAKPRGTYLYRQGICRFAPFLNLSSELVHGSADLCQLAAD